MAIFGRKKKQTDAPGVVDEPREMLPGAPVASADGLRGMADHRDYLLSLVEPLRPFGMKVLDAVGLRMSEDLLAYQDIPHADSAQVEGYAVVASDLASAAPSQPVRLPVAGSIGVGQVATGAVVPGEVVRVVAGAPMPQGTNAVVPLDHGEESHDEVALSLAVQPGQYVRSRGADISDGRVLLRKGERLDARTLGLLATAGVDRVLARPRPRVVVLATGGELVEPGDQLRRDSDTYDANSFLLAAAARDLGAEIYRVGLYTTDPQRVREAITDQLIRADLVITTGGVSADDDDLVRSLVPQLGATDFCRVAMAPGAQQGFGIVGPDQVPLVMLPGNPISAYVSFQAFVRPLIRKLMGLEPHVERPVLAVTDSLIRGVPGTFSWVRGRVTEDADGTRRVQPFLDQSSHQLGDLVQSNCLVMVDEETEVVPAGELVAVLMLDPE